MSWLQLYLRRSSEKVFLDEKYHVKLNVIERLPEGFDTTSYEHVNKYYLAEIQFESDAALLL